MEELFAERETPTSHFHLILLLVEAVRLAVHSSTRLSHQAIFHIESDHSPFNSLRSPSITVKMYEGLLTDLPFHFLGTSFVDQPLESYLSPNVMIYLQNIFALLACKKSVIVIRGIGIS